ncbi:Hsp70 family protein [Salinispora tropica]|uniref:Hsp70 family protein n=1 Tax=Salinispora tropica TaxID=168695 RepID=UPI0003AA4C01|nr:Hsp70 family protein [Salinispora tropica]
MYVLGIDLGTTYTAAATWREGRAEIAPLGTRAAVIPSVVLLRDDETFLVGETASRRGLTEPRRVAREFKRRFGDTTPLLLGGVPYSPEALMARLLRSVVDDVVQREGEPPAGICLSHPANWGPYKTDMLRQAVQLAGIEQPVEYTTEPVAAAVSYAQQERVDRGAALAVYDLGGGTFDAAVLRHTGDGFEILGQPEGIERLGGIDFDAAVFAHVAAATGGKLAELADDDPTAIAAVARLRGECVEAKEALSADTDVSIPVMVPNLSTEVRLTRAELEAMVRPALHDSIEAMRRALVSAGVTPHDLHSVLLVGGSSRMPLVAQMVGAELGRPVAVDTHPKHAVALGAAWIAADALARATASQTPAPRQAPAQVPAAPLATPTAAVHRADTSATAATPTIGAAAAPLVRGSAAVTGGRSGRPRQSDTDRSPSTRKLSARPNRSRSLTVGAAALALVLALAGAGYAMFGHQDAPPTDQSTAVAATATGPSEAAPPGDEQCTETIRANKRWACLTTAVFDGSTLTIQGDVGVPEGTTLDVNGGFHLHIFGSDGVSPDPAVMGAHAADQELWYVEDTLPSVATWGDGRWKAIASYAPPGQTLPDKVCVRIAVDWHGLVQDTNGGYETGNCAPITEG